MSSKKAISRKPSLALRLAVGSAIITGASFLASFAVIYFSLASATYARMDDRLVHEAAEMQALIARQGLATLDDILFDMASAEGTDVVHYRIVDGAGKTLAESNITRWQGAPFGPPHPLVSPGTPYFETIVSPPGDDPLRVMHFELAPGAVLQAAVRERHELQPLYELRRVFVGVAAAGLFASCVMGWIAARRVLRPLDRMVRTAQNIASGDLDDRVVTALDDAELDRLAGAFNAMLDRIQSFVRELREMNDSIAHDLRSVVARIRLAADRLVATRPLSEEQESLGVAVAENAAELLGMLDTIMDLSELNTGVVKLPDTTVDVSALLHDLVELFSMTADERQVVLDASGVMYAEIRGDPGRLRRAFANLIDNAIKYTGPGGRIEVAARHEGEAVLITVKDTGVGIASADLPKVFRRYFRADKSRGGIGHGLGLSLTEAIVRLHGGTISAASELGEGATFTVCLPFRTAPCAPAQP